MVLVVLGLLGIGLAVAVLIRLHAQVSRLAERADRVARRVEALPPDLSRVFGNHDRHIISVELVNAAKRRGWAMYSAVTGVVLLVVGGAGTGGAVVLLGIAAVAGWVWTSAVCARLLRV